jgi:hypothetical protein
MYVKTTSVTGYLRFWLLAKLRPLRRFMHRYVVEQAQIESWLATILQAARLSPALALEVAECARLIKGYGSTHKRGTENFQTIETRLIHPALQGLIPCPGRHRRHRQRPHRGASGPRRAIAGQVSGRVRCAPVIPHRCGIARIPGRHCNPSGRPLELAPQDQSPGPFRAARLPGMPKAGAPSRKREHAWPNSKVTAPGSRPRFS